MEDILEVDVIRRRSLDRQVVLTEEVSNRLVGMHNNILTPIDQPPDEVWIGVVGVGMGNEHTGHISE